MTEQKPEIMQRKVGLFEAIAMITGLVIGASIFVLVPTMAGMTGPSIYLAYAAAAIPALFVVLFEIQLMGTLPVTGANFVTITRCLSPFWGSVVSFAAVIALLSSNILVSIAFAQYTIGFVQSFVPAFNMSTTLLAVVITLIFALINFLGVTFTSVVQIIMFLAFVIGMIIFGIAGSANYNPVNMTPLFPNGAMMFIVVTVLASFSWGGLVALADIGGEVKNPRRNLPAAVIISFIIVLVLYTWQPLALVGSMNWKEAAKIGTTAIMVDAGKLMPGWGIWVIFIAAQGAILTTLNALLWSAARDMVAWARDGLLPKAVTHINNKFKTPDLALLIVTVVQILGILVSATLDKYALADVLALMLIQILLAWAVLRIPKKMPDLYQKSVFKFNAFWRWFTYLGTFITSGFIWIFAILLDMMDEKGDPTKFPWVVLVFFIIMILGVIWYFVRKAYLKSKGTDLDANLTRIADATLAEAEERQTI
jgi:APA family basic amino acid/polyamine antiporter